MNRKKHTLVDRIEQEVNETECIAQKQGGDIVLDKTRQRNLFAKIRFLIQYTRELERKVHP